ncbi:hypothetical protein BGW80DRAFT_1450018 [Lactifluus volemus]|nr:hypothetical protein BGW80DRAFT_1450018 [Lactifluus volemus]
MYNLMSISTSGLPGQLSQPTWSYWAASRCKFHLSSTFVKKRGCGARQKGGVGGGKGGDEARVSWWGPRASAEIGKAAVVRAVHRFLGLTDYTATSQPQPAPTLRVHGMKKDHGTMGLHVVIFTTPRRTQASRSFAQPIALQVYNRTPAPPESVFGPPSRVVDGSRVQLAPSAFARWQPLTQRGFPSGMANALGPANSITRVARFDAIFGDLYSRRLGPSTSIHRASFDGAQARVGRPGSPSRSAGSKPSMGNVKMSTRKSRKGASSPVVSSELASRSKVSSSLGISDGYTIEIE